MARPSANSARGVLSALTVTGVLLLLPAAVLGCAAVRYQSKLLAAGGVAQVLGAALLVRSRQAWRPPTSGVVICLYLLALAWLWFATPGSADWFVRFARGLVLAGAVGLLVVHDMIRTGLEPRRRARILTRRLLTRPRWPKAVDEYAYIADVAALHAAVRDDPTLAFDLLNDPRAEVQLAALTALQDRAYWRWEEAAVVLAVAKRSAHPDVRALAVRAVASADSIDVTLGLMFYLKDPAAEVRAAAGVALLAGGERRWATARTAIRGVLADPTYVTDGPLPGAAGRLSALAVCDLTAWTLEPPPLAERTVLTLLRHYETVLRAGTDPGLPAELGRLATDSGTPALLRVELAALLRNERLLTADLLDRLTDPDQPSPVRLIAVEVLLAADPTDQSAVDVLRGLGRQPNRETALAIARILQRYCKLEFGLPESGLTPRVAAEVGQRVYQWAVGKTSSGNTTPLTLSAGGDPRLPAVFGALDDEDALGGLSPEPTYPASVPGMNAGHGHPRAK
jgi:hypothetical protein